MVSPQIVRFGLIAIATFQPALACSLPAGGQVTAGQAAIGSSANHTNVNQTSERAVIDWGSFNIGQNEKVQFVAPDRTAITLNRIHSPGASAIDGQLTSNANVWLINPNGILFGKSAQVNVGGLLATTSTIGNDDFMTGNNHFMPGGNPDASISNEGAIQIADAGLAALVAPNVSSSGIIQAKLGKVTLGSADSFTLDLYGDGLINLAAGPAITSQLVANHGTIMADGGTVMLSAATASRVVSSLINMDGVIEADSVDGHAGAVVVKGERRTEVTGAIHAAGGFVETSGASLAVSGKITAKDWLLDPNNILIQASGSDTNVTGNPNFTTTGDSAIVTTGSIETALNSGTSVSVATGNAGTNSQAGDIEVASSIDKTSGGDSSLTLQAYRNITIDSGVHIASSSNKLNVILDSNAANAGSGAILMASGSSISSNGGDIVLGGGSNPLTGSAVLADGFGISLQTANLQSGSGNITLNGTSLNNTTAVAAGVLLNNSSIQTSGAGAITINGIGGDTAANISGSWYSAGVSLQSSTMSTDAGAIHITGTGGNSGPSTTVGIEQVFGNISSATGSIDLNGTGGDNIQQASYGVLLAQGSVLSTGTMSGATIHLNGIGGDAIQNGGIFLEHEHISSVKGDILLTGHGHENGAMGFGVGLSDNSGNTLIESTGTGANAAHITINGYGDSGISIQGTMLSSADSDIMIAGQGTGVNNIGVQLDGGVQIRSTGAAGITLTGTTDSGATGIESIGNGNITNLVTSTEGNITFVADSIDFGQNIASPPLSDNLIINAGGHITFMPLTNSSTIVFEPNVNGRYLVYAVSEQMTSFGGLPFAFTLYNCTYNGACPDIPATGNGLLYSSNVMPYSAPPNQLVTLSDTVQELPDTVAQTVIMQSNVLEDSSPYFLQNYFSAHEMPAPIYIDASLQESLGLDENNPQDGWAGVVKN